MAILAGIRDRRIAHVILVDSSVWIGSFLRS